MVNLYDINLNGFRITIEIYLWGVSIKTFPERLNYGGKTHPECIQYHFMGWDPRLNKESVNSSTVIDVSLLPDYRCSGISCLVFLLTRFPCYDKLYPPTVSYNKHFHPENAVYSAIKMRKVTNRVLKWVKGCWLDVASTIWNTMKKNYYMLLEMSLE